jgi:hypothetical protein
MYDVLYHDSSNRERLLASGLGREAACAVARAEARRRNVGRMFLAGSVPGPRSAMILIVESRREAA